MFFSEALTNRCARINQGSAVGCQNQSGFGFLGVQVLTASVKDIFIMRCTALLTRAAYWERFVFSPLF